MAARESGWSAGGRRAARESVSANAFTPTGAIRARGNHASRRALARREQPKSGRAAAEQQRQQRGARTTRRRGRRLLRRHARRDRGATGAVARFDLLDGIVHAAGLTMDSRRLDERAPRPCVRVARRQLRRCRRVGRAGSASTLVAEREEGVARRLWAAAGRCRARATCSYWRCRLTVR